jgi:RimJ/RimL family protein N-acetyltransferase
LIYLERLQVHDIEQTINLADRFNKLYGMIKELSKTKVRRTLEASLVYDKSYYALVMKDDDKVVGALVGFSAEHPYYDVVVASELGWYVEPEYRGKLSMNMLQDFESWAKKDAKANFVVMVYTEEMTDLSKLYAAMEYELVEHTYKKAL